MKISSFLLFLLSWKFTVSITLLDFDNMSNGYNALLTKEGLNYYLQAVSILGAISFQTLIHMQSSSSLYKYFKISVLSDSKISVHLYDKYYMKATNSLYNTMESSFSFVSQDNNALFPTQYGDEYFNQFDSASDNIYFISFHLNNNYYYIAKLRTPSYKVRLIYFYDANTKHML